MKPGDFALGSEKSRAAARRLVEERGSSAERVTLWMDLGHVGAPHCSPWTEGEDGKFGRVCSIPEGMTIEEAKRFIDERAVKRASDPRCGQRRGRPHRHSPRRLRSCYHEVTPKQVPHDSDRCVAQWSERD